MVVSARIGLIRRKLGRRVLYISVDSQTHVQITSMGSCVAMLHYNSRHRIPDSDIDRPRVHI